jgi:hypothetical protein
VRLAALHIFLLATFLNVVHSFAQTRDTVGNLTITGYADAYYAQYSDSVGDGNFQKFPTVSPRSNRIGLNIAVLDCKYQGKRIRAHLALHYGDIAKSTWPSNYNNIAKAHAGVRLFKNLWLDLGFFRTHFGTEMLYPSENICSSVAITTYYEPYYESGLRFEYTPSSNLQLSLYILNGYNLVEDNNRKKSLGLLVSYTVSPKVNLNYSNYVGDDSPDTDSASHVRYHNNLYLNGSFGKLTLQAGLDFCVQKHSDITNESKTGTMVAALLTLKYQVVTVVSVYCRGEIYQDRNGYMSGPLKDDFGKMTGLKLWTATIGTEFRPINNAYLRLEGRQVQMNNNERIFYHQGRPVSTRYEWMINGGVSFDVIRRVFTRNG